MTTEALPSAQSRVLAPLLSLLRRATAERMVIRDQADSDPGQGILLESNLVSVPRHIVPGFRSPLV